MRRTARRTFPISTSCVLLFASAPLAAQGDSHWSDRFDRPGLVGRVFSVGTFGGNLIAGGGSFEAEGGTIRNPALFDGAKWRELAGGLDGSVHDSIVFQDELYVGGDFRSGSGRLLHGIARWDGSSWQPVSSGLGDGAHVGALAVFGDRLHAGGAFDLGGSMVYSLARLDPGGWTPVGGVFQRQHPSVTPRVEALVVDRGLLYAGGAFAGAGGLPSYNVAAWDGGAWISLNGGLPHTVNSAVEALAVFQGSVHAGFNYATRLQNGQTARKVAAWDGTSWSALGSGIPDSTISTQVNALQVFGNHLYFGGDFAQAGPVRTPHLARWDGSSWSSVGGVRGGVPQTTIIDMTVWNGKLVVGGEFDRAGTSFGVGGPVVSNSVAAYDGSGWGGVGTGLGLDEEVFDLTLHDGDVVAVGRFTTAGSEYTSPVASFDGDAWRPLGDFDRDVRGATVWNGDLVVTGSFQTVNGRSIRSIARWDGMQWHPIGGGAGGQAVTVFQGELYAAGTGGVRRWDGSSWVSLGPPQIFGTITELQVWNGTLYLGGRISSPSVGHIMAWDGSTLTALGTGLDGAVRSMVVFQNELIVGGEFTTAGSVPASHLARWNGSFWSAFPVGLGAGVLSLAVLGGELYASGQFNAGTGDPVEYVGRFDGSGWQSLGSGILGPALALLPDPASGRLWLGGGFGEVGSGIPGHGIALWEARPAWTDLGGGLAGARGVPGLQGFGEVAAGSTVTWFLDDGPPDAPGIWVTGAARVDQPLAGGTLIPRPDIAVVFRTGPAGGVDLSFGVPQGLGAGTAFYAQSLVLDDGAPQGVAFSNGISAVTR